MISLKILIGTTTNWFYKYTIIFLGRKWPIITGAGFGLGMAYSNCQEDLNSFVTQQAARNCNKKDEGKKNS